MLTELQDLITLLSRTSIRALNLMSCRNIVPLYTTAIYDATCSQSPIAQMWVFSCAVLIAFFGCLCITFRGAYYPVDNYYYDETGKGKQKELYPTDIDSKEELEQVLEDTDCNDLVLKEQEEECIETVEKMEEDPDIDVYEDDEKKDRDDDDDDDDGGDDDDDDDDDDDADSNDDDFEDEVYSTERERTEITDSDLGDDSSTKESLAGDED